MFLRLVCFSLCFWRCLALKKNLFSNEWAVCIKDGMKAANEVAESHGFKNLGRVLPFDDIYKFVHYGVRRRHRRSAVVRTYHLSGDRRVLWTEQQVIKKRVKRVASYDDVRWKDQWYMYRRENGLRGHDMNVLPAWQKGITGKGVVVSILDDGVDYSHPDLSANYDKDASYDYNSDDPDPKPKWTARETNGHGTRCAAEVAAAANNSHCIVGVAYNANIGGIRMLDGEVSDLVEAQSLSHARNYIDIYSASWGPDDDGKTVDGPGNLTRRVLEEGAKKGRGGKGNIFVWASGNGGNHYDNCNCDGYTNSIYTIAVGTATDSGAKPWYLESCASSLVTTYGTGHFGYDRDIVTADLQAGCTSRHTGTSVAAPFVAGFVALALQVKPSLTWRDVQHLIVNTANLQNLDSEDFQVNGAGRKFSHLFGYGMVDGGALVNLAEKWILVSEHRTCRSRIDRKLRLLNNTRPLVRKIATNGCKGSNSYIRYLEHVHVVVTLSHSMRGSVSIALISPAGTRSQVLAPRRKDDRRGEFREWAFMSTHFWGEDPRGAWTVEITSGFKDTRIKIIESGFLEEWKLIFYGTEFEPGKAFSKDNSSQSESEREGSSCHPECQNGCTGPGADECTSCKNFIIQNQTCVNTCPEKYFTKMEKEGRKICQACHPSCQFCSGPTDSECTSCTDDLSLSHGVCHERCENGHFWSPFLGECMKCDEPCVDCFSFPKNCTACPESLVVSDGKCIKKCQQGEYFDGENCAKCHMTCETCSGPTQSDCTGCRVSKLFGLIAVSSHFLLNGTCLSRCPDGFFAEYFKCKKCASNCQDCRGEHVGDCNRCMDGYLRVLGRNTCVKTCPKGHFVNFRGRLCEPCAHSCEECVPGKSEDCLSCSKRTFLKGSQCVFANECDYGFYANYTSRKCQLCPYPCAACNGLGICRSCALNLYKDVDGTCVERCSSGSYLNDTLARCMACHPGCKECSGPLKIHCTACNEGKYLFKGKCIKRCPKQGYYSDKRTRVCLPCFHACAKCFGPKPNHCKKCIKNLDLRLSSCYPPCIDKYLSENSCKSCHSSCRSCFGPTAFDCLSCPTNHYLNPKLYSCAKNCPTGYYKAADGFECRKCHASCRTCNGDEASDCLSCTGMLTFFNGSCTRYCPVGFYVSQENICKPCRKECKSCLYKSDLCTTCVDGYVLNDFKCGKSCKKGYFLVKDFNRCFECHGSCQSCSGFGANECTSCSNGFHLWNSMCLFECPPGYMAHNGKCETCDINCAKCTGGSSCNACHPPYVLHNTSCVRMCPSGFAAISNKCVPCHSSCKECFHRGKDSCISCKHGLVKTPAGACGRLCPDGTYLDRDEGVCHYCHEFCKTCTNNTMFHCTSCAHGLLLHSQSKLCVHSCLDGFFAQNGKCLACHQSCKMCDGNLESNCTQCNSPRFLHEGNCVELCPVGTFERFKDGWRRCDQCHDNCLHCDGPAASNCVTCANKSVFHLGQCLSQCPDGFYRDGNSSHCRFCSRNCLHCSDINGDCSACAGPYKLKNGRCVLPCEYHFYYNADFDECQECHKSCQTCISSYKENCTSCNPHSILRNGSCHLSCSEGFYTDSESANCFPCHENCKSCTGPGNMDCLECKAGWKLKGSSCLLDCQEGSVYDEISSSCKFCGQYCSRCNSHDLSCVLCDNETRLQDGKCILNCSSGFYYDVEHSSCYHCSDNCVQCSDAIKCLACSDGYFNVAGTCQRHCPGGWSPVKGKCIPCPSNCSICHTSTNCSACSDGHRLLNGECLIRCPDGYYAGINSQECQACGDRCQLCTSIDKCTKCLAGYYKQEERCVASCSNGFELSVATFNSCIPLPPSPNKSIEKEACPVNCSIGFFMDKEICSCRNCSEHCRVCNSSSFCMECADGFTLFGNYCRKVCPAGFMYDHTKHNCVACGTGCLKCQDPETCLRCTDELSLSNGTCSSNCSYGYYFHDELKMCLRCHENCTNCSNATVCHSCKDDLLLHDGKCIPGCPEGYYAGWNPNECKPCQSHCSDCDSGDPSNCRKCIPNFWLHDGDCVIDCPPDKGVYANNETMSCDPCSLNCTVCSAFSQCLQCSNSTYLHDGQCVLNCSDGYTADPEAGICIHYDLIPNLRSLKSIDDKTQSSDSKFSTLVVVSIFAIICVIVLVWRKRNKSKNIKHLFSDTTVTIPSS